MLENRVIARLPRAMMAALSTAIGRWVITRSSLPLHLASKIPEPPLKARRAVITRSFFVSTAFNLNRPPPPPPSIFSRVPFLSLPTRKLGRFISSSNNLSSISFLPSYSPRETETRCFIRLTTIHPPRRHVITGISGNGCSFDGTRGCNNLLVLRPSN